MVEEGRSPVSKPSRRIVSRPTEHQRAGVCWADVKIEIWSDVVCPWCYVGKRRLETALAGFEHADDVEIVYRSFELDPSAPHHGHELCTGVIARKYGRSEDEMRQMQQQLIDVAAEEGLAFRLFDTVHTNTVDAHRLLHLALESRGAADPARAQGGAARGVLPERREHR